MSAPVGILPDVRDFGAHGDGTALDSPAIQRAIDSVSEAGGGRLRISAGRYLCGSLFLRSHIALELEPGSVIVGSENPADYPLVATRWEGRTRMAHAALIHGLGLSDISITGAGVLDGMGAHWWRRFREGSLEYPRPRLIALEDCTNILLRDFRARNSPSWTINPVRCRDLFISGLSIDNPPDSPNTDGINPDSCSRVRISGCRVSVGDDCITIKAGCEAEDPDLVAPCEKIVISDCILERGHGAIVLGSEMSGGIRDVVVTNCIFSGTDRGIRIKTRRGRGGSIERVRISTIVMDEVLVPFAINMHYACGARGDPRVSGRQALPVDGGTPSISDLAFSSITATGVKVAACHIEGLAESPVRNLSLSDIDVTVKAGHPPEEPEMSEGIVARSGAGFIFRSVEGLRLTNLRLRGQEGPALTLDACPGAQVQPMD